MIKEEPFIELARACARACHVLVTTAEGRDMDGLSGPSGNQIEDLGRCGNPAGPSPPKITNDTRSIRHVESMVRERANCGRNLWGSHPGSTEEYLIALRAEIWEILRVVDVHGFQLTTPLLSEPLQRDLGWGSALQAYGAEHVRRSVGPEPRASVMVRDRLSPPRYPC